MMFSRKHQNNLSSSKREEEDGGKRQNHVEEEEDVLACLSFRNLAGDSSVNDLFPTYSDGDDLEFEFLPMAIPDSPLAQVSFYPVFGGNDEDHQAKIKVLDLSIDNSEKEKKSERSISESKLDETWSSRKDCFGRPPKFVAKISFLPPPPPSMSTRRRSRIEKCKSATAATGRSLSRWRRVINLLIGKERLFLTRNKSTSPTPTNTMKKVSKDDRKRLTYLPYRSNLVALFPVNRNI